MGSTVVRSSSRMMVPERFLIKTFQILFDFLQISSHCPVFSYAGNDFWWFFEVSMHVVAFFRSTKSSSWIFSPLLKKYLKTFLKTRKGRRKKIFQKRGKLFFSNRTVIYLPTFQRFQSSLFQRADLPGARTGGLPPIGGSPSCGARICLKKNTYEEVLASRSLRTSF